MKLVPVWLTAYPRHHAFTDVLAGVVVAILVIPQSLADALLAGLPPQVGLVASVLPVLVYAWLGSSMTQAVGPVAITAIMTASVLAPLAQAGTAQYAALAAAMALMSGGLMLASGLLRLGFLAQLLSRPVVSGFIAGSALLIVVSQLKFLLGVQVSARTVWEQLVAVVSQAAAVNPYTFTLAGVSFMALFAARKWLAPMLLRAGVAKRVADAMVRVAPLLVLAVATLVVVLFGLDLRQGVAVVGSLGGQALWWEPVHITTDTLALLAMPAITLALINTVQGISMAQALAARRHERVDASQEMVGLGAANIVAAFSSGMPVGGGMSRTAVNTAAGAQTPLASVVCALVLAVAAFLGTHWLERVPLATLAASIVVAAISMIDWAALRQAWAYDRADGAAWLGTALGVLVLGLQWGIAVGIVLSLATLLLRASAPHIAVVGRIAGTEHFRNVERHGVQTLPGVLFLRIDESLFFGNLSAVEERLAAELATHSETRDVVLIMSAVNRVDATAMEVLADINRDLSTRGIRLHLAEVKGPVQDRLEKSPLWAQLSGAVHLSAQQAFDAIASNSAHH
jgi:SulP family sulfate permease